MGQFGALTTCEKRKKPMWGNGARLPLRMMAELQAKPEQIARVTIDEMLEAAGWVVQDYKKMDLTAGIGIAVREFPTKTGPVDYMLFAGEKAIGTVEAKKPGTTLLGIEAQSERYVKGFQELLKTRNVPHWGPKPLPFRLSDNRR